MTDPVVKNDTRGGGKTTHLVGCMVACWGGVDISQRKVSRRYEIPIEPISVRDVEGSAPDGIVSSRYVAIDEPGCMRQSQRANFEGKVML